MFKRLLICTTHKTLIFVHETSKLCSAFYLLSANLDTQPFSPASPLHSVKIISQLAHLKLFLRRPSAFHTDSAYKSGRLKQWPAGGAGGPDSSGLNGVGRDGIQRSVTHGWRCQGGGAGRSGASERGPAGSIGTSSSTVSSPGLERVPIEPCLSVATQTCNSDTFIRDKFVR